jgi:hypothetical protein
MIPIISACGDAENNVRTSKKSSVIGFGGSIDAYTTYSQAKFMKMDKDMYYSYLVSYRDFILVVLPSDPDDSENVDVENLMFQAAYSGVTPYSEDVVNGNFSFKNPEYKLLIYYVLAEEFLEWEAEANQEAAKKENFIASALDFLGPSDSDNYDLEGWRLEAKVARNEEEYNLKNIVNRNKYLSECDFLMVNKVGKEYKVKDYSAISLDISNARNKCGVVSENSGVPKGKNVIADVANGDSAGVTLLFGEGGLTGYFTAEQVEEYDFEGVDWIAKLLKDRTMDEYVRSLFVEQLNYSDVAKFSSEISAYANMMSFKLKYDIALLGRIRKINYNTLLDINASNKVTQEITEISSVDTYETILKGTKEARYNSGDYIAFTTADGFIMDRGNIVLQGGIDYLFDTNVLELLTQMDACTNRTLASYVAELLSTVGIVAGGIAVGVGAAVLGYTAFATAVNASIVGTVLTTVGVGSMSVPGVGWIIGAACLLVAGIIALAVGISTKNSIDETNSANFCKVYKKAMEDVLEVGFLKVPIYGYNIEADKEYTTELCYDNYVYDPVDKMDKCGNLDENKNFVPSKYAVPAFKMANVKEANQLNELSGAPSVRLYSNGQLVDEIYGAASPQFLYAIMDSWGVTSATSMKYYTSVNRNADGIPTGFNVYDLLYAEKDRERTIESAKYCFSTKYGEACSNGKSIGTDFGVNGMKTIGISNDMQNELNQLKSNLEGDSSNKVHVDVYQEKLNKMLNYGTATVQYNGTQYYTVLDGITYYIYDEGASLYLSDGSNQLNVVKGKFVYNDLDFSLERVGSGYQIQCLESNLDDIVSELNRSFSESESLVGEINKFATDFKAEYFTNKAMDRASICIDELVEVLNGSNYVRNVPIYFTVTIVEKYKKEDVITVSSVLYENVQVTGVVGGN